MGTGSKGDLGPESREKGRQANVKGSSVGLAAEPWPAKAGSIEVNTAWAPFIPAQRPSDAAVPCG